MILRFYTLISAPKVLSQVVLWCPLVSVRFRCIVGSVCAVSGLAEGPRFPVGGSGAGELLLGLMRPLVLPTGPRRIASLFPAGIDRNRPNEGQSRLSCPPSIALVPEFLLFLCETDVGPGWGVGGTSHQWPSAGGPDRSRPHPERVGSPPTWVNVEVTRIRNAADA